MATFQSYNEQSYELSSHQSYSKTDVITYISQMINRSKFNDAISYIAQIKIPSIAYANEFYLNILEQLVKLMIYQGYQLKAEKIIEKARDRAFELELFDLYVKFNIWDSMVKQSLKRSYPSVPIFESLDNYYDDLTDDLLKSQLYLQASHLNDFIASQESFLKESYKLVTNGQTTRSNEQPYVEAAITNSLGVFYGLIGENEKCKNFLELSIAKGKTIGDKRRVAGSMTNLANLHYLEPQKAPETHLIGRSMIQESIKISEEIQCFEYAMIGNLLLAEYYQKRGKTTLSVPYYDNVYKLQIVRGIVEEPAKKV